MNLTMNIVQYIIFFSILHYTGLQNDLLVIGHMQLEIPLMLFELKILIDACKVIKCNYTFGERIFFSTTEPRYKMKRPNSVAFQ